MMEFWHLTRPEDFLLNNARLWRGHLLPISGYNLPGATTPYALTYGDSLKERIWEAARLNGFGHLPARLKSLYAFQTREDAIRAKKEWFPAEERALLRLIATTGILMHVADARLLDTGEQDWPAAALRYWAGEMTDDPRPEIIIGSPVFFPDWESEPTIIR